MTGPVGCSPQRTHAACPPRKEGRQGAASVAAGTGVGRALLGANGAGAGGGSPQGGEHILPANLPKQP